MKRFLIVMTVLLAGTAWSQDPAPERKMKPDHLIFKTDGSGDRWLAPDKARHLLASAFLCGAAFWTLHHHLEQSSRTSLKTAVLFTFSLGAAKEIRDSFAVKGCSSWKDLAADLAGIILGGILLAW